MMLFAVTSQNILCYLCGGPLSQKDHHISSKVRGMKAQTQELSEVVLNNQVLVERDRAEGVNISSPSRKRISIFLTE
jgi:hypothetical protein